MCVWGYIHISTIAHRGQRCCIPLELELQAVVSCLMWILIAEQSLQPQNRVLSGS